MIVADASLLVEVLLQTPVGAVGRERLLASGDTVHAPHLIDVEVTQALRRHANRGRISRDQADRAIANLRRFPMARYGHEILLDRIWQLRDNLTAYDACYVALAEALDATLLTCDGPLARAPGHRAKIELV
jgi:predicted nucleic acid-binding protein